jgi:hypothetical protein
MHISDFIAKWRRVDLKERSAAQEHFLDLCAVLGHPSPAAADPGGEGGPWDRFLDRDTLTERGGFRVGVVRYPRLVPADAACAVKLRDRTLTKLYNQHPAWLQAAHRRIDEAVAHAYGWPANLDEAQILAKLLERNCASPPVT